MSPVWLAAALVGGAAAARAMPPQAAALDAAFEAAAERAKPAVVNITTVEERTLPPSHRFLFGEPDGDLYHYFHGRGGEGGGMRWQSEGTGSGVILDAQGDVVTNEHVVRGADAIKIALTGPDGSRRALRGRVVAKDADLDLALVRIEGRGAYPWLPLAASSRTRVGEWVLAIGSPFELEQTVTAGVVSALRQSLEIEDRVYEDLVQTDAAVNRGNSGGPLVDLDGSVVGINTAIFSPSGGSAGVGFAIAADEVRDFLAAARAGTSVKRGWLGVELAPIDDVMRRRFALRAPGGAMVAGVVDGSPASRAGLTRGDAIVAAGGQPVPGPDELSRLVRRTPPGRRLALEMERDGRRRTVEVRLARRPGEAGAEAEPAAPADASRPADARAWQGVSFEETPDGPAVERVAPDSPCYSYLLEGDVLLEVNRRRVKDTRALAEALAGASLSDGILFDVLRGGRPQWVTVQSQP